MEGLDPLDAGAADATHSVLAACAEACDDVASAARDVADETSSVAAAANSVALEGQAVSVCPTQMSLAPPPGNPNVIGAAAAAPPPLPPQNAHASVEPHAYQRQYGDPQFKARPTPQPPPQVDCIAPAIHAAYCGVQHHIDEDCRAALDGARNDLIQSSLPETGVPDDVPVCLTPPCIQEGISGRVRLLEPVAVEIVACSDKENDDSDNDDDAAAFWSDLEAHHADSQSQFRDEGEDENMYEKLKRANIMLQLAQESKNGADAAREKLVNPEIGDGTPPKKRQKLITNWLLTTSDTQAKPSNPFQSLRGPSGPVHPCFKTAEERERAIKIANLREANKKLKAFSEEKATEAAKATDLYTDYINAAVREMIRGKGVISTPHPAQRISRGIFGIHNYSNPPTLSGRIWLGNGVVHLAGSGWGTGWSTLRPFDFRTHPSKSRRAPGEQGLLF